MQRLNDLSGCMTCSLKRQRQLLCKTGDEGKITVDILFSMTLWRRLCHTINILIASNENKKALGSHLACFQRTFLCINCCCSVFNYIFCFFLLVMHHLHVSHVFGPNVILTLSPPCIFPDAPCSVCIKGNWICSVNMPKDSWHTKDKKKKKKKKAPEICHRAW